MPSSERGVTLIETMVIVAVVAIITMVALPSFGTLLEKMRLRSAAEALYSELHFARSEALKRKENMVVTFAWNASEWRYGTDTAVCDPFTLDDCERVVSSDDHPGISLTDDDVDFNGNFTGFEPMLGTSTFSESGVTLHNGTATFSSPSGMTKAVIVAPIGRIKISKHYGTD